MGETDQFVTFFHVNVNQVFVTKMQNSAKRAAIYFCGSIRAGRQDVDLYQRIIDQLDQYGRVLTPFVGDKNITITGSEHEGGDKGIHDRDVAMLEESKVIVAEVTQPSLGVGYELGRAVAMGKRILCLYRPQENKLLSAMIRGAHNDASFTVVDYKDMKDVPAILKKFFAAL